MRVGTRDHLPVYGLWIDGKATEGADPVLVRNKFTGEPIAWVYTASREDVDRAVTSAERSFHTYRLSPFQRYEWLGAAATWIRAHKEELVDLLVDEVGKPYKDTVVEVERAYHAMLIAAEEAKRIGGEVLPVDSIPGSESKMAFAIRVPLGVVAGITPFNYPFLLAVHKIAPALAAGNAIVIKPAPQTPLSTLALVQGLMECGGPPGHVQVLQGGADVGQWMLEHPGFRFYTFTGSARAGERIKAATGLRRVALELGNSSPNIVHSDANLDRAVRICVARSFSAAGQACISVQRLYVHAPIFDPFVERFVEKVKTLRVGDPRDPKTDVGPMISEQDAIRAETWVREAVAQGARLLAGGGRRGAVLEPTVLTDTRPDMKVVCEEVFAPVVSIMKYETFDEALAMANDSPYGLQAGLFTRDIHLIMRAARELQYGGLIVNDASTYRSDLVPYGGVKNSGIGREGPKYAIEEMTDLHVVIVDLADGGE
ncbi:MAG: aldehyde dehydrogenase family protein, partial [Alicyclobacillaceae bacterium]|nr:aldehyde dehydrogenase family protein [Alicyclobacillaceae bacterium]